MNETQAKMIVTLANVPNTDKNAYFLAAKLGKSYSAIYNYLKIMKINDQVSTIKSGKKTFYVVNEGILELAEGVLSKDVSRTFA